MADQRYFKTTYPIQVGDVDVPDFVFGEENVVANGDSAYSALDKLDLFAGDLGSTANAEGASLIGIEDAGDIFVSTDVEGALQELSSMSGPSVMVTMETVTNGTNSVAANMPGVDASTVCVATLSEADGTLYVLNAVPTTDTVTVTLSGNTTADRMVSIMVMPTPVP